MDKATFWSSKSPLPEFHAVAFSHPSFTETFRLVANVFADLTLGGYVHQPAPMTIQRPPLKSDARPKMTITFPRQVVGRIFKRELAHVVASGLRTPITVDHAVYLGDTITPEITWTMYVSDDSGIVFGADSVQVTATLDNPMLFQAGVIYDPTVFTGLALI